MTLELITIVDGQIIVPWLSRDLHPITDNFLAVVVASRAGCTSCLGLGSPWPTQAYGTDDTSSSSVTDNFPLCSTSQRNQRMKRLFQKVKLSNTLLGFVLSHMS